MEEKIKSLIGKRHCFVLDSVFKIPEICRWLIEKDEVGQYSLRMVRPGDTVDSVQRRLDQEVVCCLGSITSPHSTPSNTLIIILTTIFIILLVAALLTFVKRRGEINETQDSDSVINLRISATLARLSRCQARVRPPSPSLGHPPDYDTALQIKKEEEEELPSYHQAVPEELRAYHQAVPDL